MVSRSMGLGLGVLSLVSITGCQGNPSTMLRAPSNGPYPQAVDERTGVLAVMELGADGRYDTSLRRIEGGQYTQLTPPIPDERMGASGTSPTTTAKPSWVIFVTDPALLAGR